MIQDLQIYSRHVSAKTLKKLNKMIEKINSEIQGKILSVLIVLENKEFYATITIGDSF